MKPDVEALFEFVGSRKGKVFEGYRPSHLVKEGYLTTGIHDYFNLDEIEDGKIEGTITFISPEEYPGCMWIGRRIEMYEGRILVGYATIKGVFNPILQKND